jgi:hypothetical protein
MPSERDEKLDSYFTVDLEIVEAQAARERVANDSTARPSSRRSPAS